MDSFSKARDLLRAFDDEYWYPHHERGMPTVRHTLHHLMYAFEDSRFTGLRSLNQCKDWLQGSVAGTLIEHALRIDITLAHDFRNYAFDGDLAGLTGKMLDEKWRRRMFERNKDAPWTKLKDAPPGSFHRYVFADLTSPVCAIAGAVTRFEDGKSAPQDPFICMRAAAELVDLAYSYHSPELRRPFGSVSSPEGALKSLLASFEAHLKTLHAR